jgi:hypothetical protein
MLVKFEVFGLPLSRRPRRVHPLPGHASMHIPTGDLQCIDGYQGLHAEDPNASSASDGLTDCFHRSQVEAFGS